MAAGKSTAALEAAAALGETAADSDALLELELGESIQPYFARHGEAAFRAAEERLHRHYGRSGYWMQAAETSEDR